MVLSPPYNFYYLFYLSFSTTLYLVISISICLFSVTSIVLFCFVRVLDNCVCLQRRPGNRLFSFYHQLLVNRFLLISELHFRVGGWNHNNLLYSPSFIINLWLLDCYKQFNNSSVCVCIVTYCSILMVNCSCCGYSVHNDHEVMIATDIGCLCNQIQSKVIDVILLQDIKVYLYKPYITLFLSK